MHQPQYRDALTGQYELPWTYLHAVKDYTDMAAHLEGSSAARAVVNFTPLLIEQLDEIARRIAEHLEAGAPLPDPIPALLGPDPFIHDLAVWYHLAWLGETVRRTDPLVARLTERGRDFSAAHRRDLLSLIGELVGQVLPRYRRLAEAGRCELSVTPYGHPILPLPLDFRCARDAVPEMPLPRHAAYPGGAARAAWHVEEGTRVVERAFGPRPPGCR